MNDRKNTTKRMVTLAMFCAIIGVLGMTNIGFIPLPLVKATTMHIPVILGAILLGPKAGALFGFIFGLCSMWQNTFNATSVLYFIFSPFSPELEGVGEILKSVWITMGCRILLGIFAGFLWKLLKNTKLNRTFSLPIVALTSSVFHTVAVMGSIYILFAEKYAQAKDVAREAVFGLVLTTVTVSGIPEAIAAAIIVTALAIALFKIVKYDTESKEG
ncbi:MAG: ECF transporter S component [Clostridia bacterium]|nr:ECF transporter S component [Clostridia bacterium]